MADRPPPPLPKKKKKKALQLELAVALYDFPGVKPSDLPFSEGDVLQVGLWVQWQLARCQPHTKVFVLGKYAVRWMVLENGIERVGVTTKCRHLRAGLHVLLFLRIECDI